METTGVLTKEWTIVDNVYLFSDRSQYGYLIRRNSDGEERKISLKNANRMMRQGLLEFASILGSPTSKKKVEYRVNEGFIDNLEGINLREDM